MLNGREDPSEVGGTIAEAGLMDSIEKGKGTVGLVLTAVCFLAGDNMTSCLTLLPLRWTAPLTEPKQLLPLVDFVSHSGSEKWP